MLQRSVCLLCGSALVHLQGTRTDICEVCSSQFETDVACRQGHVVCSSCDSASEDELIERFCIHSTSTRPADLAVSLLNMLFISMQGPLNHFLVPAVLLTAYYNQTGAVEEKKRKLEIARQQAATVIGDFSDLQGVYSAGIGTGIFISLISDSNPNAEGVWGLANQMTTESLRSIEALGKLRCCKRDILVALQTAKKFVWQNLQIELDVPDDLHCEIRYSNLGCSQEICPFRPSEM